MKVAANKPKVIKSPVYVTNTQYDLYYAKPILLGRIARQEDGHWYTTDGMRFARSRDALDYLVKILEMTETEVKLMSAYADKLVVRAGAEQPRVANKKLTPTIRTRKQKKISPQELDIILSSLGYTRSKSEDVEAKK